MCDVLLSIALMAFSFPVSPGKLVLPGGGNAPTRTPGKLSLKRAALSHLYSLA